MKHWYIHATTKEFGQKILKEGFSIYREITWTVSFNNYIYLRKIDTNNDLDSEETLREVLDNSIYNATISASLFNSQSSNLYFFLFNLDDEMVYEDSSCEIENSYEIHVDVINKELSNAKLVVAEDGYIKEYRYIYLTEVIGNLSFNESLLNEKEIKMLNSLSANYPAYTLLEDYMCCDEKILKDVSKIIRLEGK